MVNGYLGGVALSILELFIGMVIAIFTIYNGIHLFDRLTKGMDEWKELKKGNLAVGVLLAVFILSLVLMIEPSITMLSNSLLVAVGLKGIALAFIVGLINILIALLFSVLVMFLTMTVFDQLTVDIDEMNELKKGNVAIAILLAAVFLAVSLVVRTAIGSLLLSINLSNLIA